MQNDESRDLAIFQVLVNELPGNDPGKTTAKIKRKLNRANLGPYDEVRVNQLRVLHDALQQEICKFHHSKYYKGIPGSFASLEHFDTERMVLEYLREFPLITKNDLRGIIGFAIYSYYLR
jgi:hypothetical protein